MNIQTDTSDFQYDLMAEALRYIEKNAAKQPTLDQVAEAIGLSPTHFQKVFSEWVGVSPKRYLQYLTLDHAKRLLQDRFTVLDTTFETGLSSPGRLHDLFIRWEAMTPGEYARNGKGLKILWDWAATPFGDALIMATDRGICGIAFSAETGRDRALADMRGRWPAAQYEQSPAFIEPLARSIVSGKGEVSLLLSGAPFQIHVWSALLKIPSGHVTTYSEIARHIGKPRAVRAVGTAVGRNPVSWLIPCHRALRRDGALGGYHWGLPVKRAMMAWESARRDAG